MHTLNVNVSYVSAEQRRQCLQPALSHTCTFMCRPIYMYIPAHCLQALLSTYTRSISLFLHDNI